MKEENVSMKDWREREETKMQMQPNIFENCLLKNLKTL